MTPDVNPKLIPVFQEAFMLFRKFPLGWSGQGRCEEVAPTSSSDGYPLSLQSCLLRSVCHALTIDNINLSLFINALHSLAEPHTD